MINESMLLFKPTVRKALLYEELGDGKVRCTLCERRCVIVEGMGGFCGTRKNIGGKLYTLTYGDISSMESRPIEIKPFYHYWVGSTALTFATWSCNFTCPWCQNYSISKIQPNPDVSNYHSSETIINLACQLGDEGLCASFQEPTLLTEWALDVFKIGSSKGFYCCYVSNGYMTLEALRLLKSNGMDGLKIDIKGDAEAYRNHCGGLDVDVVWRNAHEAKKLGIHVEIVNLVITGVNDDEECLRWVIEKHIKEVGHETPLHFTRYSPAYKFYNPPTKTETLEKAYRMAKEAGVHYPYVGNLPGHLSENTYCPNCGKLLISRFNYRVVKYRVTNDGRCPDCGWKIPLVGRYINKPIRFI